MQVVKTADFGGKTKLSSRAFQRARERAILRSASCWGQAKQQEVLLGFFLASESDSDPATCLAPPEDDLKGSSRLTT
jgi:hypothetical protein